MANIFKKILSDSRIHQKNKKILFYPGIDISKFAFSDNQRSLSKKFLKIPKNNIVIGTIGNQVLLKLMKE